MKTILIENIDGYDVIKGFGNLTIDQVSTRQKTKEKMRDTQEFKTIESNYTRIKEKREQIQACSKIQKEVIFKVESRYREKNKIAIGVKIDDTFLKLEQTELEKAKINEQGERIKGFLNDLNDMNTNLQKYIGDYQKKENEIYLADPVYFEPRIGEEVIDDETFKILSVKFDQAVKDGNKIDKTGQLIIDKRGTQYLKEGKICKVEKLGEDVDGPLLPELTAEELETERYKYMSLEEIDTEKQGIINSIAAQAAGMRSQLEIQGDSQALEKAQMWYNSEVEKVELKYIDIIGDRTE